MGGICCLVCKGMVWNHNCIQFPHNGNFCFMLFSCGRADYTCNRLLIHIGIAQLIKNIFHFLGSLEFFISHFWFPEDTFAN